MTTTIGAKSAMEHATLTAPPLHIPDGNGGAFKTELTVSRTTERVEKIQWWYANDPRTDPHNHPWDFESTIETGGYTETRWTWFDGDCGDGMSVDPFWEKKTNTYVAGDKNVMPQGVFHTVHDVLPDTRTRMITGALVGDGDWGYLIDDKYVSAKDDPTPNKDFFKQLCELNPHKRPVRCLQDQTMLIRHLAISSEATATDHLKRLQEKMK